MDAAKQLPEDRNAAYTRIIDAILGASDLDQISAKKIRTGLQAAVNHDISGEKAAINQLIMTRFDKFNAERMAPIASSETPQLPPPSKSPMPKLSGSVTPGKNGVVTNGSSKQSEYSSASPKRSSDGYSTGSPPAKKRVKQSSDGADADAMLAARLQAEENNLRRPTRGGGTRKRAAPLKKSPKKKAKSSTKIKSGDDSAVSSEDTEDKPSKRGGAFNKVWALSEPMAALTGTTSCSRPQCVKRIWEYIRAHDLQMESDKRQIRCDDTMRAVFKQDNVQMFSMNKIIGKHLYPFEGEDEP